MMTDTEKQQLLKEFRDKFTHMEDSIHRLKSVDSESIEPFLLEKVAVAKQEGRKEAAFNLFRGLVSELSKMEPSLEIKEINKKEIREQVAQEK